MTRQRVLLVGPDQEENLTLRYLASALMSAGHDVVIAPFNRAGDQASVIEAARGTTLVGLSLCFQVRAREFLALACALKAQAPGRWIVAGGHYASCAAEDLLAHHPEIDLVVIHEGERTLVELADAVDTGALPTIRGLALREGEGIRLTKARPLLDDLDALPPPLRTGPARLLAGVPTAYLLGSRGCIGSCTYCCITTLHRMVPGKRFRQRDPERIAEEMGRLYHDRGVRQFIFHDDNFLVPSAERNHRRLDALQDALHQRGVRDIAFTIKCRPQDVQEPVLRRLREMGLIRVFLGVESASQQGLTCLGRQQTSLDAESTLELCQQLGISAQFTMMIFHPAATLDTCRTDLDFMSKHIDFPLNFCRTEIYAGTPLEREMVAAGRARGSYLGRSYSFDDPRVQRISDLSARLFLARCWATGSLMERSIGMDHLTAVMQHFYSGKQVERLAARILSWRLEVNRDTLRLLDELFELGSGSAPGEPELDRFRLQEESRRRQLRAQGMDLFEDLNDLTLSMVGLERKERSVAAVSRPASSLARHAAAALLAVGAASWCSCDERGVSEYAPPPVDARIEIGVSEYAPPPVDAGPEVRVEIGVSEYAPPPVDAGPEVRIEIGVCEYAPPPVDAGDDGKEPDSQ